MAAEHNDRRTARPQDGADDGDWLWRAGQIRDALKDADQNDEEGLLAMLVGRFLANTPADERKAARRDMIRLIDAATKVWVVSWCDS
jgi:hypothetical protein